MPAFLRRGQEPRREAVCVVLVLRIAALEGLGQHLERLLECEGMVSGDNGVLFRLWWFDASRNVAVEKRDHI